MGRREEENKALVLEFLDALGSFEPERFEPYLAEHPTYRVGMSTMDGRAAFRANAAAGKALYPRPEQSQSKRIALLADGDWVAVLHLRRAATNLVADYENVYAVFVEVVDGKIATQVEVLDSAHAMNSFDLSALTMPAKGV